VTINTITDLFTVPFFAATIWLGLYLLDREPGDLHLRWTGAGLLVYASIVAGLSVRGSAWVWPLLIIGASLWVIDLVLARRGVLDLGEAFWPDLVRSFEASALACLLFGAPVALTMALATGATTPMRVLLLAILAMAIATQVFGEPLQRALDRFAFRTQPYLQQARADLRTAAETLPKVNEQLDVLALDEAQLVHLTRRALSHYGDLPRLAASPLARLPVIEARLATRQTANHTLTRATELKQLLLEAITHLKPPGGDGFQPTDAWRHYNALYFPYVAGLKPYSRRADHTGLDSASRQALDWLQTQVPERTLYNWQNAAARLVAQYLLELHQPQKPN
jgi:hypothetical protein